MRALLTAMLAFLLLAVTGCGGGDSSSDTLSASELVKQADAVCKEVNTKTGKLPTPTDLKSAATTITKTIAILLPAEQKLASLKPPKQLESAYNAWVVKTGQVVATAKKAEASAKAGDAKALQKNLQQGVELNRQTNALAAKVGLKVCSTDR